MATGITSGEAPENGQLYTITYYHGHVQHLAAVAEMAITNSAVAEAGSIENYIHQNAIRVHCRFCDRTVTTTSFEAVLKPTEAGTDLL